MRKLRSYAEVYNDMDGEIVNLFRVLRDTEKAAVLKEQLHLTPYSREEFESSFLEDGNDIERARRTLVKSYQGFGTDSIFSRNRTGFRSDVQRSGTISAHDWAAFSDHITAFTKRLSGVVIEHREAVDIIQSHDSTETLFYVDPPYMHSTRGESGRHRYRYEMTDENHRELSDILHTVRGMVVLSGYQSDLYSELYADWHQVQRNTRADGARERTEVLWINPAAAARLQPSLF